MVGRILFDRLSFFDRLKRAGVSDDQARAHVEVIDEALRQSTATNELPSELEHRVALAVRDITIRIGGMLILLFAALALIKFR